MRIITVNLETRDIKAIQPLVGDNALYPSRSELIRVAIRDFLIKELKNARTTPKVIIFTPKPTNNKNLIKVPTTDDPTSRDFKTYRIVDRDEKLKERKTVYAKAVAQILGVE